MLQITSPWRVILMPADEIQYFSDAGANQDPFLQDWFNPHHPCWVKDDTLQFTILDQD